ncbi:unnamed protein product [Acanthoscelides obtectus]|uniref:Uncharacterized protein n=2 Tax=Acanthoscelides obtectus TaxID=200917 RepID=A0A9P0JM66_ACAOB|nr:unnamed protein product [Acanthoscelides obtectus]CAK1642961.1 hypothetical protein AOBTE_LOCUS13320 [Acanthoscelides obtectus]
MSLIKVCTPVAFLVLTRISLAFSYTYNPFFQFYQPYAYLPTHTSFLPPFANSIFESRLPVTYEAPAPAPPPAAMTVLAEVPHSVSTKFSVVPMTLMSKDDMKAVSNDVQIMNASKDKPVLIVKTKKNNLVQCTPAVRIQLDKPLVVYSLKSSIVFPSEIEIVHKRYKIPVKVGAVMAPVAPETYVSLQTPVTVKVVYAIPTEPVSIDYINNEDAIIVPETEAVIVESEEPVEPPPKNVTILEFPKKEAEPSVQAAENDGLSNRNPTSISAPAGIVQSTQPLAVVQPFHNSKESQVLIDLREEAKRKRL